MAGVKGRSGDRKKSDLEKRHMQIDKCWSVMMDFVCSDAPIRDRAEVASRVCVKSMTDKKEHNASISLLEAIRACDG